MLLEMKINAWCQQAPTDAVEMISSNRKTSVVIVPQSSVLLSPTTHTEAESETKTILIVNTKSFSIAIQIKHLILKVKRYISVFAVMGWCVCVTAFVCVYLLEGG